MKKRIISIISILLLIFSFLYYKANVNKPRDIEIDTYMMGDVIDLDDLSLEVKNVDFIKSDDKKAFLKVTYELNNNSDSEFYVGTYLYTIEFFNGYESSSAQNIIDDFDNKSKMDLSEYEITYSENDFFLPANDTQTYVLYYLVSADDLKKDSSLLIHNRAYFDKYKEKLNNGIFYYKIIEIGDRI